MEVEATPIPLSCRAGFDYEATTNSCKLTTNLGGGTINPGNGNNGNPGGGNNTNTTTTTSPRTVDFTLTCTGPTRGRAVRAR